MLRAIVAITIARTVLTTQTFSDTCHNFERSDVPYSEHGNVLRATTLIVTAHTVTTTQRLKGS